jgi:nitrate reductase alpha subunit
MTQPDMTMSPSNPFLMVWNGGMKPIFDTKQDSEVLAHIAGKLSDLTGDGRYRDYFKYITEVNTEVYMQRILDASNNTEGYQIRDILNDGIGGRLMMSRTTPRIPGWEQINESQPFYNKTGRLEFYREEDEFIEYGENTIVYREPVEATPYLPNAIVSTHSWIRPDDYGIPVSSTNLSEVSVRNVKKTWDEVKNSPSPLYDQGFNMYCMTNKSRHTVHSSWANTDWNLIWSSSFGDPLRMDKRQPASGEHQIIMNPESAKERGINDGDYVWVDGNPADRPYIGWKETDEFYKIARCKMRVKLSHAFPKNVTMMKHASAMATHKSVMAHEARADGLAKSADTGYQATVRYGSQQSVTRGHLQPTMMTDSLVRKDIWGNKIGKGYMIDVHAPNTCPKETMVKITKAEDGGIDGVGLWDPIKDGLTPGNENEAMKRFIKGDYISVQGAST